MKRTYSLSHIMSDIEVMKSCEDEVVNEDLIKICHTLIGLKTWS